MSTLFNNRLLQLVPGSTRDVIVTVVLRWLALVASVILALSAASTLMAAAEHGISVINTGYQLLISFICVVDFLAFWTLADRRGAAVGSRVVTGLRVSALETIASLGPVGPTGTTARRAARLLAQDVEALRGYVGDCLPWLGASVLTMLTVAAVLLSRSWPCALAVLICAALTLAAAVLSRSQLLVDLCSIGAVAAVSSLAALQVAQELVMPFGGLSAVLLCPFAVAPVRAFARSWWLCHGAPATLDRIAELLEMPAWTHGGTEGLAVAKDAFPKLAVDGLLWASDDGTVAVSGDAVPVVQAPAGRGKHFRVADEIAFGEAAPAQADGAVSFSVVGNGLVALVGTGAGSVARALLGEVAGYAGSVRICDIELRDLTLWSLCDTVVPLEPDGQIFAGTIRSNLLLGCPGADDDELLDALCALGLEELVLAGGGLDDELWPDGANLAPARRRALCFARAALGDAPIYLLGDFARDLDDAAVAPFARAVRSLAARSIVVALPQVSPELVAGARVIEVGGGAPAADGETQDALGRRAMLDATAQPVDAGALDDALAARDCWRQLVAGETARGVGAASAGAGEREGDAQAVGVVVPPWRTPSGRTALPRAGTAGILGSVGTRLRELGFGTQGKERPLRASAALLRAVASVVPSWLRVLGIGALGAVAELATIAVPALATCAILSVIGVIDELDATSAIVALVACVPLAALTAQLARALSQRVAADACGRASAAFGHPLPSSLGDCARDEGAARVAIELERLRVTFVVVVRDLAPTVLACVAVSVILATRSLVLAAIALLAFLLLLVAVPAVALWGARADRSSRRAYAALLAEALASGVSGMVDLTRLNRAQDYVRELSERLEAFSAIERRRGLATTLLCSTLPRTVALAAVALLLAGVIGQAGAGGIVSAVPRVVACLALLPRAALVAESCAELRELAP